MLAEREGQRLDTDARVAEAAARYTSIRRIAEEKEQYRVEGVHSLQGIAAQAERLAGLVGTSSGLATASRPRAASGMRQGPQYLMVEGSPGHRFAGQVQPGQLGQYTGSLSSRTQRRAGAQALIMAVERSSRQLCPAAMCNYWGCRKDPSLVNIRTEGYVCPLCLRHVFCSRECASKAGHPGVSIQCWAHHGWE